MEVSQGRHWPPATNLPAPVGWVAVSAGMFAKGCALDGSTGETDSIVAAAYNFHRYAEEDRDTAARVNLGHFGTTHSDDLHNRLLLYVIT